MKCSFCGNEIEVGTGTMYVSARGQVYYFCSHKCMVNLLKLGRNPRHVRWTKTYRLFKAGKSV